MKTKEKIVIETTKGVYVVSGQNLDMKFTEYANTEASTEPAQSETSTTKAADQDLATKRAESEKASIIDFVKKKPGASLKDIYKALGRRSPNVLTVIHELERTGALSVRGIRPQKHYVTSTEPTAKSRSRKP